MLQNRLKQTFSLSSSCRGQPTAVLHKLTLPSEASPLLHPEEPDYDKGAGREGVLTDVLVELQ